jgi:cytidine deaminase
MITKDVNKLIEHAYKITGRYQSSKFCISGVVGCALLTKQGNIYTGINIDSACGLGFCAEHSAITEMLKHRESEISMLVAVNFQKEYLPPCGRCREFIYQVNPLNLDAKIVLGVDNIILLKDLLPYRWQESLGL